MTSKCAAPAVGTVPLEIRGPSAVASLVIEAYVNGVHFKVMNGVLVPDSIMTPPADVYLARLDNRLWGTAQLLSRHTPVPLPDPAVDCPDAWSRWIWAQAKSRLDLGVSAMYSWRHAWRYADAEWHRRHRGAPDPARCAGCGLPFAGKPSVTLLDGASVHAEQPGCPANHNAKWRCAARDSLLWLVRLLVKNPDEGRGAPGCSLTPPSPQPPPAAGWRV